MVTERRRIRRINKLEDDNEVNGRRGYLDESSEVEWWPTRYVIASIITGVFFVVAILRASTVALYTAQISC